MSKCKHDWEIIGGGPSAKDGSWVTTFRCTKCRRIKDVKDRK